MGCCSSTLAEMRTDITQQFQQNSLVYGFYIGTITGFITQMRREPELFSTAMPKADGHLHPCSLLPHRWVCGAFLRPHFTAAMSYLPADNQPTADFVQPEAAGWWEPGGWLGPGPVLAVAACLTSSRDCSALCQYWQFIFYLSYSSVGCLLQPIVVWQLLQITVHLPTAKLLRGFLRRSDCCSYLHWASTMAEGAKLHFLSLA